MSQSNAVILVQDIGTDFSYGPGWVTYTEVADVTGSTLWARDSNDTSLTYTFQGVAVSFVGNTPHDWTNLTSSIDDGTEEASSSYRPGQAYEPWWTSPPLADGTHKVSLRHLSGIALDYVTVTPGPTTPLAGKTLIADDTDASMTYRGSWQQAPQSYLLYRGGVDIYPYQNTTHASTTPGDSMSFSFAGTSVSVFGVVQWPLVGSVATTYSIDGVQQGSYVLNSSGVDPSGQYIDRVNFPYFASVQLAPGPHVLEINVTQRTGAQIFALDYITYKPSFSALADIPKLTSTSDSSTPSSTSTSTSSSSDIAQPTSLPIASATSHHSVNAGAIAGGTIGGLIFFILLILIWRRLARKTRYNTKDLSDPKPTMQSRFRRSLHVDTFRHTPVFRASPAFPEHETTLGRNSRGPYVEPTEPYEPSRPSSPPYSPSPRSSGHYPSSYAPSSFFPPSTDHSTTISLRQAALEQQLQELKNSVAQIPPGAVAAAAREARIAHLQQQIDILIRENMQLQAARR